MRKLNIVIMLYLAEKIFLMLWYFFLFIYKVIFIYNLDGQRPDFTAVEMCSFPGKLYLTIMMLCFCFFLKMILWQKVISRILNTRDVQYIMSLIRFRKIQVSIDLWISVHAWFSSYSVYGRLCDHVSSRNTPLKSWYITPTWDTVWNYDS